MEDKNCEICGARVGFWSERQYHGKMVCPPCFRNCRETEETERQAKNSRLSSEPSTLPPRSTGDTLKLWGRSVLALSFLLAFFGLTTDVTGGTDYVNLGLMDQRRLFLGGAAVALLMGAGLLAAGMIVKENKTNFSAKTDTRKCPFCAEIIKAEAVVCRYCGKDLEAISQKVEVKSRTPPEDQFSSIPELDTSAENDTRKESFDEALQNRDPVALTVVLVLIMGVIVSMIFA